MNLKDMAGRIRTPKDAGGPKSSVTDGTLIVQCEGCPSSPDPGSDRCIGCLMDQLMGAGSCDRMILRNGNDRELSGAPGRFLAEAASIRRWSMPGTPSERGCARCGLSPDKVIGRAWADFPEESLSFAREMLDWEDPGKEGCRGCKDRTSRILDDIEHDMRCLVARMVEP